MPVKLSRAKKIAVLAAVFGLSSSPGFAATALFLGNEFQSGDPASDQAFADFLGTATLTNSSLVTGGNAASQPNGNYATWATVATSGQTTINFGSTTATISITGWDSLLDMASGPSGNASLGWFGNNSSSLQAGSPRPGFASGSGSGFYVGTTGGSSSDNIRNAVTFNFATAVSAFGIFGGDLETGGPNGSPLGFLNVAFSNGDVERINYTPDPALIPGATFSGNNNTSQTYGNETGRFVGISDDTRLISSVTFVVGDDDIADDGDNEQLSFIAPVTFSRVRDGVVTNLVPDNVPEPGSLSLLALGAGVMMLRRRP